MMISVCSVEPPESELKIYYSDLLNIALYNCMFSMFRMCLCLGRGNSGTIQLVV